MTTTPNIASSSTFQTWFDTTNDIINVINGISLYNAFAGDGVNITSSNNDYTFSHSNVVNTGITFNGSILFSGSVDLGSAATIGSVNINVTPKIDGVTSGNIVIISPTLGLTLAKADNAVNAEVFGIVSNQTSTSTVVTVGGNINNTLFSKTIGNCLGISGATLIPGQAYFLSPTISGGITTFEPNTYGSISKPILLGITGNSGLILQHRGIVLEGISAGITAELDNKIIVEISGITGSGNDYDASRPVKIGDPVIYYADVSDTKFVDPVEGPFICKLKGKFNNSSTINIGIPKTTSVSASSFQSTLLSGLFLGLISKILSETVDGSGVMTKIFEVTTIGGAFNVNISDLDPFFYPDTTVTSPLTYTLFGVGGSSTFSALRRITDIVLPDGLLNGKFCDYIKIDSNTAKIILQKQQISSNVQSLFTIATGGLTSGTEYDNLIPNGAFSIWQRHVTGLTQGSLNTYSTPFADRWFVVKNGVTGLTASITRQTFDSYQTDVPGSPLYFVDCNFQYTSVSDLKNRPKLENIQKEARFLQGQNATLSFWGFASGITGCTLDLVYNRYKDQYTTTLGVTTDLMARELINTETVLISPGVWQEYKYTFSVGPWNTMTTAENGWFSIGFEFPSCVSTISLAQVQLDYEGSEGPVFYVSQDKELERCKPYYQRSYDLGQTAGYNYSENNSTKNEYTIQTGNLTTQSVYFVKFPSMMVGVPQVAIYTPNGILGDAFNINANRNMVDASTGELVLYPWSATQFYRTSSSSQYGNITTGNVSKNGTEIVIMNGALSLDALQFHYIADSDLNLNV